MIIYDEQSAREYVRKLKEYYTGLATKAFIIIVCIVIWGVTGGGFWPIWVILGLGIPALIEGIRLGVFPMLPDLFPFMRPDWEERQLQDLLHKKEKINNNDKIDQDPFNNS